MSITPIFPDNSPQTSSVAQKFRTQFSYEIQIDARPYLACEAPDSLVPHCIEFNLLGSRNCTLTKQTPICSFSIPADIPIENEMFSKEICQLSASDPEFNWENQVTNIKVTCVSLNFFQIFNLAATKAEISLSANSLNSEFDPPIVIPLYVLSNSKGQGGSIFFLESEYRGPSTLEMAFASDPKNSLTLQTATFTREELDL